MSINLEKSLSFGNQVSGHYVQGHVDTTGIIKKLDIKPGQKILEVGCGWGGMAFEIARQKKCEV